RLNIVVSGSTGAGKTTTLNVLSSYIPSDERIVTIEDAAELQLRQEHVVTLETRPANVEGRGAVHIRELVINSLRMRPDRIVVGECRGGEALDMLQAMNTGHDGSLTTAHANSPSDCLARLETMVLMSGADLPSRAIREQISSAINIIAQQARLRDGTRKITSITEVLGFDGERVKVQDIFRFRQTGVDGDGKVLGHLEPTGTVPRCLEHLSASGEGIDPAMFAPLQPALSGGQP
ncbi:MAG TPA: ATPase, T2SS/T4P/T4SS family, partial [Candidatus Dormibacteraeota bacterium]|nr:ATPase, T2SS/T4P/T4SS family [Candidatus Dormibacteraeota bacterium]